MANSIAPSSYATFPATRPKRRWQTKRSEVKLRYEHEVKSGMDGQTSTHSLFSSSFLSYHSLHSRSSPFLLEESFDIFTTITTTKLLASHRKHTHPTISSKSKKQWASSPPCAGASAAAAAANTPPATAATAPPLPLTQRKTSPPPPPPEPSLLHALSPHTPHPPPLHHRPSTPRLRAGGGSTAVDLRAPRPQEPPGTRVRVRPSCAAAAQQPRMAETAQLRTKRPRR